MDILLLKNSSTVDKLIVPDLGIELGINESTSLIANFENEQIIESLDLQTAMSGTAEAWLTVAPAAAVELTYQEVIDYFTQLSKYDKLDYSYISAKDDNTDVTGAELERLTNGTDASATTQLHTHDTRYYTKTNLQTTGEAVVAWTNISGVPAFGSLQWKDPVDRTNSGYGSGSILPVTANLINDARMVKDDGDGKPAQYVCVATTGTYDQQWKKIADIDWGSANSIAVTPAGNLSSSNIQSALEELQGDINNIVSGTLDITHSLQDAYDDGSTIAVSGANVVWALSNSKSFTITDGTTNIISATAGTVNGVALTGSVGVVGDLTQSGGTFSLTGNAASTISVSGANLNITTTTAGDILLNSANELKLKDKYLSAGIAVSQTGVTALDYRFTASSIVGALNELKTMDAATTLQQAYDGSAGSGTGRSIVAANGSVKIDASGSTNAPLELVPHTTMPSTGLAAGQIVPYENELYMYDASRSKWLSIDSTTYILSANSVKGQIMPVGSTTDINVGYIMPQNACLVKVSVSSTGGDATHGFEVRKVGSGTALKSFNLVAGNYSSVGDNINLNAGEIVQVYVLGNGTPVKNVVVTLFIKWRPN